MALAPSTDTRAEWRILLALAWPIVTVNVGAQMMAAVDTALSGRITSLAQAGTGLGSTVFFFGALLGMGVVMGMDPLASQSIGAGRPQDARTHLWQGTWLALMVSVPLVALTYFAGRGLEFIGIAPELADEARRYLDANALIGEAEQRPMTALPNRLVLNKIGIRNPAHRDRIIGCCELGCELNDEDNINKRPGADKTDRLN